MSADPGYRSLFRWCFVLLLICAPACRGKGQTAVTSSGDPKLDRMIIFAMERTRVPVTYDGRYRAIPYPGGDVPDHVGVCTDLVIRAYRAVGVDLQRLVHEDMVGAFDAYPQKWGLDGPDSNIDHRRVPNLQAFFERSGAGLAVSADAEAYKPGELVTWMLPGNLPHVGIVTGMRSKDGKRYLIVHNIGAGPQIQDVLFDWPITGHYRYHPWK